MADAEPAAEPTRVALRAMGTNVTVVVQGADRAGAEPDGTLGGDAHADDKHPDDSEGARVGRTTAELLERLEARWSRFRPTSELSRLNAAAGSWVVVSPDTFDLVTRAVDAWRDTAGSFDPTVLPALLAAGYDRDFAEVVARDPASGLGIVDTAPAPGCGGIGLDATVGAIRLPPGVALDLGGIGKGRAADLVVRELLRLGARGALADLGGDVRVMGEPRAKRAGWSTSTTRSAPAPPVGCRCVQARSPRARDSAARGPVPGNRSITSSTRAPACLP